MRILLYMHSQELARSYGVQNMIGLAIKLIAVLEECRWCLKGWVIGEVQEFPSPIRIR